MPKTTHGMTKTKIYQVWAKMIQRCHNPCNPAYKWYGAKNIRVCKRWHEFENFYTDMGQNPEKHSLDRINCKRGYSKSNCRWATSDVQASNKTSTHFFTYNGITRNLRAWVKEFNLNKNTVATRLHNGWPIEEALQIKPHFYLREV